MNQQQDQYILAVDIGKETLEVKTVDQSFSVSNDKNGFKKIVKILPEAQAPFVVLEASGGYEKALMSFLFEAQIPVARISPCRVRAFARSEGIRAKNDVLDAAILLRFAQEKRPKPAEEVAPELCQMAELLDRRTQISDMLTKEKNRLQMATKSLQASVKRIIRTFEAEMVKIEKQLRALIAADASLKAKCDTLMQVSGVGEITAWSIIAYVPEACRLNRNQLVALVGLAPYDKDSSTIHRPRRIEAGRGKVRAILYMAAQVASIHNPVIRPYVDRLKAAGKPHKSAITAAMRKLLIHLQSRLKALEKPESL